MLINEIYKDLLIEDVSVNKVNDAIDNTYEVMINYHSNGEDIATGERIIHPVAYGLTKAGNPVIRAFQPYGDTTSKVPSWKFFRLDRITYWKSIYNKTFKEPPGMYNAEGDFNPSGDKSMSIVYKIADFNKKNKQTNYNTVGAVTKDTANNVYKTDTEKGIEHLRKQLENPKFLSHKTGPIMKNNNQNNDSGPIIKPNANGEEELNNNSDKNNSDIYKTDTEKGIEHLRKQLENPRYISDLIKNNNLGDKTKNNGPIYKN